MEINTIVFECPKCGEKFHTVPNNWKIVEEKISNGESLTSICPKCGAYIKSTPVKFPIGAGRSVK